MADQDFLGTLAAVDPADWGAMGRGLLSSPTWASGVAAGSEGVEAGRAGRAKAAMEAQMMGMKQTAAEQATALHEKKMAAGQYTKLGPYSVMDTTTQEIISLPPEQMARLAAMKTSGKLPKGPEYTSEEPVYDEAGNMWFRSFNKQTRENTWEGPGGEIRNSPPPGAKRPQDSIYGEIDKIDAANLKTLKTEYAQATDELQSAERSLALLADPDVWTGFGSETILGFKNALVSMGMADQGTIDTVGKMDEFRKLSFEFVMKQVAGTKGAVSDREMDLFAKASPGLAKSEQGNQRILEGIKLISERKQEQHRFMNRNVQGKGMPYWKAEEKWEDYIKANPLFTKDWFELTPSGTPEPTGQELRTPEMQAIIDKYSQ